MTGRIDQRNVLLAIAVAALIICAATINFMGPPAAEAPAATTPPAQDTTAPAEQEADAQDKPSASDLWSDDGSLHRIKPLAVDLDAETQWAIYEACGYDPGLFSLVMAIAEHESEFQPDLQGDNGQSIGMMQINTKWHTGRMEALGVTDLTDPVQCAAVAIDYLRELEDRYGFEPESHELCLAYNMGPSGARKALADGITSNNYSESVLSTYQNYLAEMEAAPGVTSTEGGKAEQSPTKDTNIISRENMESQAGIEVQR